MKFAKMAIVAAVFAASPVLAQAQAEVTTGATVYGPEGNQVGTIVSVGNGQAVLDTGTHKVPLAIESYGQNDKGLVISVTKAQLEGMVAQATAQATAARDAALVVGANVMAADHAPLGTIIEINGDNIVIARGGDETRKVTLLREYFTAGEHGLMARLTNAQIDAAMAGTAAPAAAQAAPTDDATAPADAPQDDESVTEPEA